MSGFKKLLISFALIDLLVIAGCFTAYSMWQQRRHEKIARTEVVLTKFISEHQADIDYLFIQPEECKQRPQPKICGEWPKAEEQLNRLFGDSDQFVDLRLVKMYYEQGGNTFVKMIDMHGHPDHYMSEYFFGDNPVADVVKLLESKRREPATFEQIFSGNSFTYVVYPYFNQKKEFVGGIAVRIDNKVK